MAWIRMKKNHILSKLYLSFGNLGTRHSQKNVNQTHPAFDFQRARQIQFWISIQKILDPLHPKALTTFMIDYLPDLNRVFWYVCRPSRRSGWRWIPCRRRAPLPSWTSSGFFPFHLSDNLAMTIFINEWFFSLDCYKRIG